MMGNRSGGLSQESLKVLKKIASPREVKVFVSPSCPYCPQQAVNALKAAVERPDLISLEIIDIQANPDLAEQYSAQSVPQTYANDVLVAQGAQAEELFLLSLDKMEQQTIFIPDSDAQEVEADLVIIGGGRPVSPPAFTLRAAGFAPSSSNGSPRRSGRHDPCGRELPRPDPGRGKDPGGPHGNPRAAIRQHLPG